MPLLPKVLAALLCASLSLPAAAQSLPDVPGAADPPGLPRISGASILGYDASGFDAFVYPTDTITWDGPKAKATVEGPRTRILYLVPGDRSPLEVMRNYQAELTDQGFTTLYTCSKQDCGPTTPVKNFFYATPLRNAGEVSRGAFSLPRDDQQVLIAQDPATGRTISLYIAFETFDHHPETADKVLVLLDQIEGKPLERKMEFVTAEAMASDLGTLGRVSLYGILFDYDSDRLRPDSDPTLAEIVKLMGADPKLSIFVVGHTDMTGTYAYNLNLSRRRAASVVAALTGRFGIAPDRLEAAGVGPLAPVAENLTEAGRTLNRRVELVRR